MKPRQKNPGLVYPGSGLRDPRDKRGQQLAEAGVPLVDAEILCPRCDAPTSIVVPARRCVCGEIIQGCEREHVDYSMLPRSQPTRQLGVLHVSQFPKFRAPRACIVGKGPSATHWREVDADVIFTVNEACYLVDRACYAVRGDPNIVDHRFMEWLPSHVTPIVPERLREHYQYGWFFQWTDIGLEDICLTTLMAIRLAYHLTDAQEIVCCGLDSLHTGERGYLDAVANERNRQWSSNDQRPRVRALEPEIYARCRHWDGDELVPRLLTPLEQYDRHQDRARVLAMRADWRRLFRELSGMRAIATKSNWSRRVRMIDELTIAVGMERYDDVIPAIDRLARKSPRR